MSFSKPSMTWESLLTKEGTVYTVCSAAMVLRMSAPLPITEQDELIGSLTHKTVAEHTPV